MTSLLWVTDDCDNESTHREHRTSGGQASPLSSVAFWSPLKRKGGG